MSILSTAAGPLVVAVILFRAWRRFPNRESRFALIGSLLILSGTLLLLALRRKFAHPKLKEVLLATKNRELIENSPFDTYRVIGRAGAGKNRLGKLLMQVRSELMSGA